MGAESTVLPKEVAMTEMLTRRYLTVLRAYAEEASKPNKKQACAELAQQLSNILKRIDLGFDDNSVRPFARMLCAARYPWIKQHFATCPFEHVRSELWDTFCVLLVGAAGNPVESKDRACAAAHAFFVAIQWTLETDRADETLTDSREILLKPTHVTTPPPEHPKKPSLFLATDNHGYLRSDKV